MLTTTTTRLRAAAAGLPLRAAVRTLRQSSTTTTASSSPTTTARTTQLAADNKPVTPATVAPTAQAPNRAEIWSRSQKPRAEAMVGPRFEQTDFELQPQPYAAIELIHKEPVRWTHERVVACDGGGDVGAAGHPRVYINTDKPEIAVCGYCGVPFAHEHHRKHLESLPATSYPL
ncbi:hypothetical protein B0T18DRAFT_8225 [Schizothecium vesticola]|uniref:Zinc finger CHCC-type domain-containing protein n=1 Tax=Schizothecium vesticola TaxID=314040 RepID=A0AA40KBT1_9PEZI|nr:hypothetical protein B0T18DRAFT_8225 [Schizothecium vesticola]